MLIGLILGLIVCVVLFYFNYKECENTSVSYFRVEHSQKYIVQVNYSYTNHDKNKTFFINAAYKDNCIVKKDKITIPLARMLHELD